VRTSGGYTGRLAAVAQQVPEVVVQAGIRRIAAGRLAGLTLLLVVTTAAAAEWETVGTDADGNVYSVDVSRMSRDEGAVSIVVRTEYATPRRIDGAETDVFVALDQMVVDCGKVSFAVQSRTLIAADGTEIPRGSTARANLRFRAAAAGSMSETIVRFACGSAAGGKQERG
jgi:hypothetical protein